MNRIDRLSAILIMLQSAQVVTTRQILSRFDIGLRTLYRDIRALEDSGIPIAGDSGVGYSLVEGFKLSPLMFSQQEAYAFLIAEALVDKFTDSGLSENYKSGVDKIRAVMPSVKKEGVQIINTKIGSLEFDAPSMLNSKSFLPDLMDGIARQQKVEITYFSYNSNSVSDRLIDPVGVFFSMANWYLVAFCNHKQDYRTFKLSRFRTVRRTDLPIEKQHPPLDYFLKKKGDGVSLQKVTIEVAKDDLYMIDERKYYQGLTDEIIRDNVVELHFMTFSLERLARWFLSYIDIATITYSDAFKKIVGRILSSSKLID